jgi:hypothetical protein
MIDAELLASCNRWLLSQKISLATFRVLGVHQNDVGQYRAARERLIELLDKYRFDRFSQTLPPDAINILNTAKLHLPRGIRKLVETRYSDKLWHAACHNGQLFANTTFRGTGGFWRLARLGEQGFVSLPRYRSWNCADRDTRGPNQTWRTLTSLGERAENWSGLEKTLMGLRDSGITSLERLKQAVRFCELLDGLAGCEQIANAILFQLFSWPLLVMDGVESAIALPILVDVSILQPGERHVIRGRNRTDVVGLGDAICIDTSPSPTFRDWLQRSCDAAAKLWRSQNGRVEFDFRQRITNFQGRFDFTFASDIVGSAYHSDAAPLHSAIPLVGGSASAYFSQVLLQRLTGSTGLMHTVISGEIGEQITRSTTEQKILNFHFGDVGGIKQKLRWVFESGFTDGLVVPLGNSADVDDMLSRVKRSPPPVEDASSHEADIEPTSSKDDSITQTAQVSVGCHRLSDVANVCQPRNWRRSQFIRCPEIGRALSKKKSPDHDSVAKVVKAISESEASAVISLEPQLSPFDVAEFARHVDTIARTRAVYDIDQHVHRQHQTPALSWIFIRASPEEEDCNFWRLVWNSIGASDESLDKFLFSSTVNRAGELLVKALNRIHPTHDDLRHIAPDLLVIIGLRDREPDIKYSRIYNPIAPAKVFKNIKERKADFHALPDHRSPSGAPGVWKCLAEARVILVDEPEHRPKRPSNISRDDWERSLPLLESLSVFDYGFSHHGAAMVLREHDITGKDIKEKLNELKESSLIGEFSGEYFMNDSHRTYVRHGPEKRMADPIRMQSLARSAGQSMAPYSVISAMPRIPLARGFSPESISDARTYLVRARRWSIEGEKATIKCAKRQGPERTRHSLKRFADFQRSVNQELRRIDVVASQVSRRLIYDLWNRGSAQLGRDHEAIASYVYNSWIETNPNDKPHPMLALDYARALTSQKVIDENTAFDRGCELYETALELCDTSNLFENPEEDAAWYKVHICCWYAEFLSRIQGSAADKAREMRSLLDQEVWRLREGFWGRTARADLAQCVPAQWLERQGDECEVPTQALERYSLGYAIYGQRWTQFRFKALGASAISEVSRSEELGSWLSNCNDIFGEIIDFAKSCRKAMGLKEGPVRERVRQYWQAAADALFDQWGSVDGFAEGMWAGCQSVCVGRRGGGGGWIEIPRPDGW